MKNVIFDFSAHLFFTIIIERSFSFKKSSIFYSCKKLFFYEKQKKTQDPLGALCSTPFLSNPLFLLFAFEPCEHGPQFLEHKILQRVINLKCCFFVWPIRGFSAAKNRQMGQTKNSFFWNDRCEKNADREPCSHGSTQKRNPAPP